MDIWVALLILLFSYLVGGIPFGLLVVRLRTGKDIRFIESGRTGGTNAMRAAGLSAGIMTAILDLLKAASAVWLSRWLLPGNHWIEVLAPIAAVLGHNYSIFLTERTPEGKLRLRGGAGGAPTAGGAIALWPISGLIIIPVGIVLFFLVGYASLATMSIPFVAAIIFAYRAWIGVSPWHYVLYGVLAEILLVIALLPNIRRLLKGTERVVGLRARQKKVDSQQNETSVNINHLHSNHSSSSSSSP